MIGMNNPSIHHQQEATLLPVLQNSTPSSSSSSASSPLSFTDSTNSHCHRASYASSFSGADQSSISFSPASFLNGPSYCASAATGSFYQPQESLMMSPIELVAASCSYSKGSYNNNNNSSPQTGHHVKEAEAVGYGVDHQGAMVEQMVAANNNYDYYLQNIGMEMEETQNATVRDGDYVNVWTGEQNGLWEENPPLDYGIEEIKQLISSSSCNNFLFDENMTTQKRALYYY